jgi:hypothetical protein
MKPKEQQTPEDLKNEAFKQNKLEAFGLQLKEESGTITPVEQERLGLLQAKMNDFWAQRQERASRSGFDISKVSCTPREGQAAPQLQPMWRQGRQGVPMEGQRSLFDSPQQSPALPIRAKLTIGEPGDQYEQEADRVASQVVEQINAPASAQSTQGQSVQRQEESEEELQRQPSISNLQRSPLSPEVQREAMPEEDDLQAKSILQRREAIAAGEASTDLDAAINSARGGGQPLDAGLQRSMGQAMGADFSGVRVHTDAQSDQLNQSIQAKAFTTGQDMFFRQGAYEPGSRGGQELIAHELTHVVQQNSGAVQRVTGNSPVGALIQRLTSKGKKTLKKMDIKVKDVEDWQKSGGLSDADADKVVTLGKEKLEEVLQMSADLFKGAATCSTGIDEMYEMAKTKSKSKAMGEALSSASTAPSKPPILVALNERGIDDDDAKLFIKRVGAAAITPWLNTTKDNSIVRHMIIASNKENKTLLEMNALVVTTNQQNYDQGKLLNLVTSHGYNRVLEALQATVADNNFEFLNLWLSYGVTTSSSVQLKRLVRFQARLRTIGAALSVYKADIVYVSSQDPPSRTGFLRYNFGNETMEIHTHWNELKRKIVSIHIQDNSMNGIEINTWNWFEDVAKAVLTAHNTSDYSPTTQPVGEKLTL